MTLPGIDSAGGIHRLLTDFSGAVLPAAGGLAKVSAGQFGDKLFGYAGPVAAETINAVHAAGTLNIDTAVPAGQVWIIDSISGLDNTSGVTGIVLSIIPNGSGQVHVLNNPAALAVNISQFPAQPSPFTCGPGDVIRDTFTGTLLNDNCRVRTHGYFMNAT